MNENINNLRVSFKFLLLSLFIHILVIPANAVLPPEQYAQRAEKSKIKAIATVVNVEVLSIGKYSSFKEVTFKLEYDFIEKKSKLHTIFRKLLGNKTPDKFTGLCSSVDTKEQNENIMAGGTIYFYPYVGSRVFVSISEDGGSITTLTKMTAKLEKSIRDTPEKLKFRMGSIYISK